MKVEINNESKKRFFAQYWGQSVLYAAKSTIPFSCMDEWSTVSDAEYLELKPLSMISNEDAQDIGYVEDGFDVKDVVNFFHNGFFRVEIIDRLRSKGFALPWMGITVEEQVASGWVKLKTE